LYITVEDALALPAMTKATLLAGKDGLQRKIVSVNIMEVPDISDYVKSEELLVTTMYPIQGDILLQQALIPALAQKGVSAIAIAPITAGTNIPECMIEQAHLHNFPLIRLPYGTSFNDILNPILEQILERKHIETEHRFRARIIGDILQGKNASKSQLLSLGKFYGWKIDSPFFPVLMDIDTEQYEDSGLLLQNFSNLLKKHGIFGTIVADVDEDILFLFPHMKTPDAAIAKIRSFLKLLLNDFPGSYFGMGRSISDILQLPAGFSQAKHACVIAKCFGSPERIAEFEHLGVYKLLLDSTDASQNLKNKRDFVSEKLGSIIEFDTQNNTQLLRTLRTFLEANGNLRQAAKDMFIHHNTMRYRLNQIEALTNSNFSSLETKLEFLLALKLSVLL